MPAFSRRHLFVGSFFKIRREEDPKSLPVGCGLVVWRPLEPPALPRNLAFRTSCGLSGSCQGLQSRHSKQVIGACKSSPKLAFVLFHGNEFAATRLLF